MFGRVEIVSLSSNLADPNSVDAIVTFRNLHNWLGPEWILSLRVPWLH
ncbi:MAG: hypothetical protein CM1200mP12_14930 [Gammaproteobacteria bacterium]|nr:MAG: hypothetical protein CM1200mP12_14930 [Gammaproteobacteria bacterium]